jgi:hypothetical protein
VAEGSRELKIRTKNNRKNKAPAGKRVLKPEQAYNFLIRKDKELRNIQGKV